MRKFFSKLQSWQIPQSGPCAILIGILLSVGPLARSQNQTVEKQDQLPRPTPLGLTGTCFPKDNDENAANLARATVQTRYGPSIFFSTQGSAVVIANSAGVAGSNRLLTVAHVLGDRPRHGVHDILLTASDDTTIGIARPVAIPRRYHHGGSKYDIAVLEIVSFDSKEAEAKYRSIEGIKIAPIQAKSGYMHGLVNDPVSPSFGSSGGAATNPKGQLVGLADFTEMRHATRKVEAVAIGSYARLNGKTLETPIEGRTFAVSVTPRTIIKALGAEGTNLKKGLPPAEQVTITSYPGSFCSFSHGLMAPVIHFDAAVTNFDTPADQKASIGLFTNWQKPKAAYAETIRLLKAAEAEHLSNEEDVSSILTGLNKVHELKKITLVSSSNDRKNEPVTIDTVTDILRSSSKLTHNANLAKDLKAASEHLPISWYLASQPSMPKRFLQKFSY